MSNNDVFLNILGHALTGVPLQWEDIASIQDLKSLLRISENHSVLPLITETLVKTMPTENMNIQPNKKVKKLARSAVIRQAEKTAEFLLFYKYLSMCGLHPIVLKGIICRSLYLQPEQRPSTDEDLLIAPDMFPAYHKAITEYGLSLVDPDQDYERADEISYRDKERYLYIEVHKHLFPTDSAAVGNLNFFFKNSLNHSITETVYGTPIHTLDPTDHLLYLILHAFKHFLYSGFGIRQICDIALYSEFYWSQIGWKRLKIQLKECNAFDFACAVFKIAQNKLIPDNHMREYLYDWDIVNIDEQPLLKDVLESGLYGDSSMSRLHSSTITLHSVEKSRGNMGKQVILKVPTIAHSVFLPLKDMVNKYPYLRKRPFLLPFSWCQRLLIYLLKTGNRSAGDNIVDTIKIGQERIELLKLYNVIK